VRGDDVNQRAIREALQRRSLDLLAQPRQAVVFTRDEAADKLLNDLEQYPHAFVVACLMDRQWLAEQCWLVPHRFRERLGSWEMADLANLSREKVIEVFVTPPPLHRMKEMMAGVFYEAVQRIASQYSGRADRIWEGCPSSATIVRRFLQFHGAGPKIATMAANILVRDLRIGVSDKYSIDISPDVQVRRVFGRLGLVGSDASDAELVYTAREMNPEYPGIFDLAAWEIGRQWCHPRQPDCAACEMVDCCPTAQRPWMPGH